MMKNKDRYAVAVRKPDHDIEVCVKEHKSITERFKILGLPFIRGVFNFIDSMILGISTLTYSAGFYEEEETEQVARDDKTEDVQGNPSLKEKAEGLVMGVTVAVSIVLALGLFIVLPSLLSDLIHRQVNIESYAVISLIEGIIRIMIFLLYIILISRMKDIQRTFMYHGAEHKCINCIEHGLELNVENVLKSSRLHRRCGTSFLFLVMAVSIIFFILIPIRNPVWKVVIRLLFIPVIAGVSYEILRLAGRSNNLIVRIVSAPGMALQKLTTNEPDAEQVEVAIKAVEAVFDWRAWLQENFGYEADGDETAEDEEPGETVENPEEMTGEDLSDEDQREAEEEQYEDWEEADREAEEEQYGEWEEADREAEEAECEDWEEAEEEAYENSGKMSAQPRQGENRRQSRQPAEELWGEDEDEPSFIGNDEIE